MTLLEESSAEPVVVDETHRNRKAWWIAIALIAVAALIGTGIWLLVRDGESDGATTTGAAPFHAIPADAVGVTGTATCRFSDNGTNPETGASGLFVVCELDMSDPRVSGTETTDRYRFYIPDTEAARANVWVAEEAILTNEEGTWRGFAQAADDSTPCGETHYLGEGGYEGLEFHYYFCHVGDPAQLRGWISGSV